MCGTWYKVYWISPFTKHFQFDIYSVVMSLHYITLLAATIYMYTFSKKNKILEAQQRRWSWWICKVYENQSKFCPLKPHNCFAKFTLWTSQIHSCTKTRLALADKSSVLFVSRRAFYTVIWSDVSTVIETLLIAYAKG